MTGSFIPTRFEVVRVKRVRKLDRDALGNDVWVDEETRESVNVAGWAKPVSDEPKLAGHDRITVEVEMYAPAGAFQVKDAVILPGRDDLLEVIGEPEEFSNNPFSWDPGLEVVNLGGIK